MNFVKIGKFVTAGPAADSAQAASNDNIPLHMRRRCGFCGTPLRRSLADLDGFPSAITPPPSLPLCETETPDLDRAFICETCFLVQVDRRARSDRPDACAEAGTLPDHAGLFADRMCEQMELDRHCQIVELGGGDGVLVPAFGEKGIPVLALDVRNPVPAIGRPFGIQTARKYLADGIEADLLYARNVLSCISDLHDFIAGVDILLKPDGVAAIEVPHLLRQIESGNFRQICDRHDFCFSLHTLRHLFNAHGMTVYDLEELSVRGGTIRLFVRHHEDETKPVSDKVRVLHENELTRRFACLSA